MAFDTPHCSLWRSVDVYCSSNERKKVNTQTEAFIFSLKNTNNKEQPEQNGQVERASVVCEMSQS